MEIFNFSERLDSYLTHTAGSEALRWRTVPKIIPTTDETTMAMIADSPEMGMR